MAKRPEGAPTKTASATPLTEAYIAKGDWNPLWDAVRTLDPEFVEAYLAFRSVPHRKGPLPPKFKELVLVAINVATTHLYAPGARRHMQNALRLGATAEEILEVIQLTTVMGIHSVNMAVPMLVEELAKAGAAAMPSPDPASKPKSPPKSRSTSKPTVKAASTAASTAVSPKKAAQPESVTRKGRPA